MRDMVEAQDYRDALAERDSLKALNAELLEALKEMLILAENERVRPTNYAVVKATNLISKIVAHST